MASKSILSESADIRKNQPNIAFDKEDKVENVCQLKKLRNTAKGFVTRKRNEINDLLSCSTVLNIDELNKRAQDLETVMEKFRIAHTNYHENLQDEGDIEESNEYFEAERTRGDYLMERIANFIEHQSPIAPHVILPEDSVRNIGKGKTIASIHSKIGHKSGSRTSSSVGSTTSSAKAKAIAKKAALEVEATNFKKQMALQQEELQLQQKQEMLNLEIELEKAKAEEQAYMKIEKENHSTHSVLLQENSQTQPSLKNDQSPVQSRPVGERKHGQETPVELKDQSLNPTAKEWTDSYNLGSQLTNATERAEPSLNGAAPHSSDAPYMSTIQRQQNHQLERLMIEQQRYTAALSLPQPEVPTFKGEPLKYCSFIRAFENLIETKTDSSNARLYYFVQYTAGDVQELVRSCLTMSPEEGYREARRLLKEKYGQNYKIAAAYVDQLTKGPPLKTGDGGALQKFCVLLTSNKNALKDIGYLSKLENPDALKRIVERLPYGLRQKWREVVDDVIQRQSRDVTVEDRRFIRREESESCDSPHLREYRKRRQKQRL